MQRLTDRQLRYFGVSLGTTFFIVAAAVYLRWRAWEVAAGLAFVGMLLMVVYYVVPASQRIIASGFQRAVAPLQWFATVVVLAVVFFLVVTPIGLVLRIRGTSVRQKRERNGSFWLPAEEPQRAKRYFDTY